MAYVPVELWVPDTAEGSVTDAVHLKPCETCRAAIPEDFMDEHVSNLHSQEVTPH